MKEKKSGVGFWRKNAYYIIIAVCAAAIVTMSTFAIIGLTEKKPKDQINNPIGTDPDDTNPDDTNPDGTDPDDTNPDDGKPVNTEIIFAMPVSSVNVIKECTTEAVPVMLNTTTGKYMWHMAIDFGGAAGDAVLAAYDGVIESNTTDLFEGTTIVIDHGKGLKTIYKSLAEAGALKAGDTVKKGDKIGEMSLSYRLEFADGPHLHFEVEENGNLINPGKYLLFEEK